MATEIHVLWFAFGTGLFLLCLILAMMWTRKRLAIVQVAVEDARSLIRSDRIGVVEKQIQIIFDLIERRLASMLHAPTHQEMDQLLQKLTDQTITPEEATALYSMLLDRSQDLIIEGTPRHDLKFPELFVLWSLEVRIARAGLEIPRMSLARHHPSPQTDGGG